MKHYNIPFNLDDYNNGGYTVETAGYDKPETVRIICTDRSSDNEPENKIVALKGLYHTIRYLMSFGRLRRNRVII